MRTILLNLLLKQCAWVHTNPFSQTKYLALLIPLKIS
jgi:hypothetical protein